MKHIVICRLYIRTDKSKNALHIIIGFNNHIYEDDMFHKALLKQNLLYNIFNIDKYISFNNYISK